MINVSHQYILIGYVILNAWMYNPGGCYSSRFNSDFWGSLGMTVYDFYLVTHNCTLGAQWLLKTNHLARVPLCHSGLWTLCDTGVGGCSSRQFTVTIVKSRSKAWPFTFWTKLWKNEDVWLKESCSHSDLPFCPSNRMAHLCMFIVGGDQHERTIPLSTHQ